MSDYRSVYSFAYGIFDVDGTLLDSIAAAARAFATPLHEQYGFDIVEWEKFYLHVQDQPHGMIDMYRMALDMSDIHVEENDLVPLANRMRQLFHDADPPYFPHAARTVRVLARRGLRLFVSSMASQRTVKKRIRDGGIRGHVEISMGSSVIRKGREHVIRFAQTVDTPLPQFCENAFLVGDTSSDMRIANEHGMYAIGVEGTLTAEQLRQAGAHRVISAVHELIHDRRR